MILAGPIINALAVLAAGLLGALLRRGLSPRITETVTKAVAMCVIVIGIRGAIRTVTGSDFINENIEIIAVVCLALGALIGELLRLDERVERLGARLGARFSENGAAGKGVGEGFVSATMIFCIGAWAITGSIASASGEHSSLITKGVVDAITALMLSASLGWGVALSSISLLVYQGGLTLLAFWLGAFLSPAVIGAMGIVGSILIMMVGTNLLGITRIRVANMVPAMFLPLFACFFIS